MTPTVDEKYKCFLWNYIKLDKDLEFYENIDCMVDKREKQGTLEHIPSENNTVSGNTKHESEDSESEVDNELEEEPTVVKNNQSKTEDTIDIGKHNLKLIENARNMDYNEIKKYGESFCMVASTGLQEEQLYIGVPTGSTLSSNMSIVLKCILRSRYKGVYQADISKLYNIDPRSAGHYCKSLEEKGCIVRRGVSICHTRTNVCIHARFASDTKDVDMSKAAENGRRFYNMNINNQSYNQLELRDAMIELVKDAPGQRILAKDVLGALGFKESKEVKSWFNRSLNELCMKGFFKKSNLKIDNKGRYFRCIHLLKLPEEKGKETIQIEVPREEVSYPIRIKSTKGELPILHYLHDTSIQSQLYQVIEASGKQGVIAREIMFSLNMDEHRLLYKVIENTTDLIKLNNGYYSIHREFEFEGRSRRYRYFTGNFYLQVKENREENLPPLSEVPYDFSECSEANMFKAIQYKKVIPVKNKPPVKPKKAATPTKRKPKTKAAETENQNQEVVTVETLQTNQTPDVTMSPTKRKTRSKAVETENQNQEAVMIETLQTNQTIGNKSTELPQTNQSQRNVDADVSKADTTEESIAKRTRQMVIKDFFGGQKKRARQPEKSPAIHSETKKAKMETENESMSDCSQELEPIVILQSSPRSKIPETNANISILPAVATEKQSKRKEPKENGNPIFKSFFHNRKSTNVYMEQRMQILKEFLDKTPFIEIDYHLKQDYQKRMLELNGGSMKSNVCIKTIRRSIRELEEKGEASIHTFDCPLINGSKTKKTFFMRGDQTKDGPEYNAYLEYLKSRYTLNNAYSHPAKYENISIPVERLNERLERMREELNKITAEGNTVKATTLKKQIEQLSNNYEKCMTKDNGTLSNTWLISAVQYGYNCARMVRAKKLHEYLINLLNNPSDLEGVNRKESTITSIGLVANIPVGMLCEVIGISNTNDTLNKFLGDKKNLNITLYNTPEDVRLSMVHPPVRFRNKLKGVLVHLEYLDLVIPCDKYNRHRGSSLAEIYTVNMKVELRDKRKIGAPLIREFTMLSKEDIYMYWSELDYLYRGPTTIPTDELAPPPEDKLFKTIFMSLEKTISWVNPDVYSKPQRRILNSYVDKINLSTPLDNDRLIEEIALDINCTPLVVRAYYSKVEGVFSRRNEIRKARKIKTSLLSRSRKPGRPQINMLDGRTVLHDNEQHAFKASKVGPVSINNMAREPATLEDAIDNEKRALYLDDLSSLPLIKNRTDRKIQRRGKARRLGWSESQEELLLLAVVILKCRGQRIVIRWPAITQVLEKSIDECRRRYSNLLKTINFPEKVDRYLAMWEKFYKRGIVKGDIVDKNPYEAVNFDLLGYVSYFIEKLALEKSEIMEDCLPKTVKDIYTHFEVLCHEKSNSSYMEDDYHRHKTMAGKIKVINKRSFLSRGQKVSELDDHPGNLEKDTNSKEKLKSKYRCVALMALFTPSEKFNVYYIWLLLQNFPAEIADEVLESLVESNVLIKYPKNDRIIPGKKNALSQKFGTTFAGELPLDLNIQAKEYYKFLNGKEDLIPLEGELLSSGMMACVLDLVSRRKLIVDLKNRDEVLKKASAPINNVRIIKAGTSIYGVVAKKVPELKTQRTLTYDDNVKVEELSLDSFDSMFNTLLANTEDSGRQLLKDIVGVLKQKAGHGLVLSELKEELGMYYLDKSIHDSLETLRHHSPPLVYIVGYSTIRYVLNPFVIEWSINTSVKNVKRTDVMDEFLKDNMQIPEKNGYFLPKLWTDVNGTVTTSLLRSFCRSIVDLIVNRPGVTTSTMLKHFNFFITRKELHDILVVLIEQGVVKEKKVIVNCYEKTTVFSKSRTIRCSNNPFEISNHTQTSYWVNSDYYNYLE
ncbi:unnamed protein product [Rhizopus stolonifer]